MIKICLNIICFGMLLVMSSLPSISKEYTLEMNPKSKADVCEELFAGSKRYVTLPLDLGPISVADSLFGFTLYVKFDSDKLFFDNAYTINTLSEPFTSGGIKLEEQGGNHILGSIGTITNFDTPSIGELPLVNLRFMYLGDCADSAMIVVEELSFTSESKIPFFKNDTTYIYGDVLEGENRYAKVEFEQDEKNFGTLDTISGSLFFDLPQEARIQNLELSLDKDDNFGFSDFTSENSGINIDEILENDSSFIFKLSNLDNENQSFIKYSMYRKVDEDFTKNINSVITSVNECNCVTQIYNTQQTVVYKRTSVTETNEQTMFDIVNQQIQIKVPKNNVEVYDLNGNCSKYQDTDIISFDDKNAGLYLIIIKAQNKIEKVKYLNIK